MHYHRRHPTLRLVIDNTLRGLFLPTPAREVRLKLLQGARGTVAASSQLFEELSIVHDNCCETSFRNPKLLAKADCVSKQLFSQCHIGLPVMYVHKYAVFIPRITTGKIPHVVRDEMRENARTMSSGLRKRLKLRLKALGITANAASVAAGRDRDYIGDLFKNPERSPRWSTIQLLATALHCDPSWLATGNGEAPPNPDPMAPVLAELGEALAEFKPDEVEDVLALVRGIRARNRLKIVSNN